MLLALSGTTDIPKLGSTYLAKVNLAPSPPIKSKATIPAFEPDGIHIQDWADSPTKEEIAVQTKEEYDRTARLRIVGLMFIVGWIFVSVRLLSLD